MCFVPIVAGSFIERERERQREREIPKDLGTFWLFYENSVVTLFISDVILQTPLNNVVRQRVDIISKKNLCFNIGVGFDV